jgi:hypothetical protein
MSDWVDTWARQVAHRISRRQMLGGVGAVAAGTALGALGPGAVAAGSVTRDGIAVSPRSAARLTAKTTCPTGYVPCGDICCDPDGQCISAGTQKVCSNACGGNAHFQTCNGVCQDVYYDPSNCGYCGHVCPPPPPRIGKTGKTVQTGAAVCLAGKCGCECDKGYRECVDANGRCVCVTGSCPCDAKNCPPPGECCFDVCTDLSVDPANCGSCGHVCPECPPNFSAVCTNGTCSCKCLAPYTLCGSTCTDTGSDPNNCGTCGNVCAAMSKCTPAPGFTLICLGGQCVDFEEIIQVC